MKHNIGAEADSPKNGDLADSPDTQFWAFVSSKEMTWSLLGETFFVQTKYLGSATIISTRTWFSQLQDSKLSGMQWRMIESMMIYVWDPRV